jgi:hypothetical protein
MQFTARPLINSYTGGFSSLVHRVGSCTRSAGYGLMARVAMKVGMYFDSGSLSFSP